MDILEIDLNFWPCVYFYYNQTNDMRCKLDLQYGILHQKNVGIMESICAYY